MKNKRIVGKIIYAITLMILFVFVYLAYQNYQSNNFNDFVRSETKLYTSEFKRDDKIKYDKKRSYRITSEEYNNAMFYKTIELEKDTPYRVSCMVKTKDVIPEVENSSGIGAQISIEGTTERSIAITGTNGWQKIELIFNSKDRESVNLGFRLGGYLGDAKGQAWFSEFTLEEGISEKDNRWNFGCFIFKETDVEIDGKRVQLSVTDSDIRDITNTIERFESACQTLSDRKMSAKCDIYEIEEPIRQLVYDQEFGYYVGPENIETQIKAIMDSANYDHIFVIMRLRR